MFKVTLAEMLKYPVHFSIFVTDFLLLLFLPMIRPPLLLCAPMLAGLVYLSMFFGAKFFVPSATVTE